MTIRFDEPCPNKPFTLHPVKRRASRRAEPRGSVVVPLKASDARTEHLTMQDGSLLTVNYQMRRDHAALYRRTCLQAKRREFDTPNDKAHFSEVSDSERRIK
jgi:hypothetical protein